MEAKRSYVNLPKISIEDLLISLNAASCLKLKEVFELIRVASAQQSNPSVTFVDITIRIHDIIMLRPSTWVKDKLGVLATAEKQVEDNIFIMAAARNDIKVVMGYVDKGQELSVLHTELQYTALHAAADFGAAAVVEFLLTIGFNPNIRDARLGRTALHFAAQNGRSEIIRILLDNGADRSIVCFQGDSWR